MHVAPISRYTAMKLIHGQGRRVKRHLRGGRIRLPDGREIVRENHGGVIRYGMVIS